MINFALSFSALTLFITGCAGMQQAYQDRVCNENGGYEKGMNDARASQPMNLGFAQVCPAEAREVAQRGYRTGYNEGLISLQNEQPAAPSVNININGNGGAFGERAYFCEVHAFTSVFSGWGPSETEAQAAAKGKCMARYHEMHCSDFKCRRS